jgi:hypothetical protein
MKQQHKETQPAQAAMRVGRAVKPVHQRKATVQQVLFLAMKSAL